MDSGASAGGPEPRATEDALRRIEERLQRASDAAERLISEAASAARAQPPPAGWQAAGAEQQSDGSGSELELLMSLLQSVRELIPLELERRLAQALRELLLALRALIDWYLERSEHRRAEPAEVEDIPIL